MARQLIIVSREDPGLFHALRADWAGREDVAVIMDRRFGRRRRATVATVERRRADRRQHSPVEAYLTWRGGGATARRSDMLSMLGAGSPSIAVRQRPHAKAASRAPRPEPSEPIHERAAAHATISAPTNLIVALVILLGTISGGIFSGVALWLFLTNEFSFGSAGATIPRSRLIMRWQQPLKKLLRGCGV